MSDSNLKNIVVLNNLPSNIIDEAIIVLKSRKFVKKLEMVDKGSLTNYMKVKESDDYIIKEAENVISCYMSKIEKKNNPNYGEKNIETKYKKIKTYSILISILLLFCIIKIFFR